MAELLCCRGGMCLFGAEGGDAELPLRLGAASGVSGSIAGSGSASEDS